MKRFALMHKKHSELVSGVLVEIVAEYDTNYAVRVCLAEDEEARLRFEKRTGITLHTCSVYDDAVFDKPVGYYVDKDTVAEIPHDALLGRHFKYNDGFYQVEYMYGSTNVFRCVSIRQNGWATNNTSNFNVGGMAGANFYFTGSDYERKVILDKLGMYESPKIKARKKLKETMNGIKAHHAIFDDLIEKLPEEERPPKIQMKKIKLFC